MDISNGGSKLDNVLLRVDYIDVDISCDTDRSFYNSAYFYIPFITIVFITSVYYCYNYYSEDIFNLWLEYYDLSIYDRNNITTPNQTSPSNYSDYFKSPELPLIDLSLNDCTPEGSPTPKAIDLQLNSLSNDNYLLFDPFNS